MEELEKKTNPSMENIKISRETLDAINHLQITLQHNVLPQHNLEDFSLARNLSVEDVNKFERYAKLSRSVYSPAEDKIIKNNWESFCRIHGWDSEYPEPFLKFRHNNVYTIKDTGERKKFVQFLANGLPNRPCISVYKRFRYLYNDSKENEKKDKYTPEESEYVLSVMEKQINSGQRNTNTFARIGQVIGRSRHSVWLHYNKLISESNQTTKSKEKVKGHKSTRRRSQWQPSYNAESPRKSLRIPQTPCNETSNVLDTCAWNNQLTCHFIRELLTVTKSDNIAELKNMVIPDVVWSKLAEQMSISKNVLKQIWKLKFCLFMGQTKMQKRTQVMNELVDNHSPLISYNEYVKLKKAVVHRIPIDFEIVESDNDLDEEDTVFPIVDRVLKRYSQKSRKKQSLTQRSLNRKSAHTGNDSNCNNEATSNYDAYTVLHYEEDKVADDSGQAANTSDQLPVSSQLHYSNQAADISTLAANNGDQTDNDSDNAENDSYNAADISAHSTTYSDKAADDLKADEHQLHLENSPEKLFDKLDDVQKEKENIENVIGSKNITNVQDNFIKENKFNERSLQRTPKNSKDRVTSQDRTPNNFKRNLTPLLRSPCNKNRDKLTHVIGAQPKDSGIDEDSSDNLKDGQSGLQSLDSKLTSYNEKTVSECNGHNEESIEDKTLVSESKKTPEGVQNNIKLDKGLTSKSPQRNLPKIIGEEVMTTKYKIFYNPSQEEQIQMKSTDLFNINKEKINIDKCQDDEENIPEPSEHVGHDDSNMTDKSIEKESSDSDSDTESDESSESTSILQDKNKSIATKNHVTERTNSKRKRSIQSTSSESEDSEAQHSSVDNESKIKIKNVKPRQKKRKESASNDSVTENKINNLQKVANSHIEEVIASTQITSTELDNCDLKVNQNVNTDNTAKIYKPTNDNETLVTSSTEMQQMENLDLSRQADDYCSSNEELIVPHKLPIANINRSRELLSTSPLQSQKSSEPEESPPKKKYNSDEDESDKSDNEKIGPTVNNAKFSTDEFIDPDHMSEVKKSPRKLKMNENDKNNLDESLSEHSDCEDPLSLVDTDNRRHSASEKSDDSDNGSNNPHDVTHRQSSDSDSSNDEMIVPQQLSELKKLRNSSENDKHDKSDESGVTDKCTLRTSIEYPVSQELFTPIDNLETAERLQSNEELNNADDEINRNKDEDRTENSVVLNLTEDGVNSDGSEMNDNNEDDTLAETTVKKVQQMKKMDLYGHSSDSSSSEDEAIVPRVLPEIKQGGRSFKKEKTEYKSLSEYPESQELFTSTENVDDIGKKESDNRSPITETKINGNEVPTGYEERGESYKLEIDESDEDKSTAETTVKKVQQMKKLNLFEDTSSSNDEFIVPHQVTKHKTEKLYDTTCDDSEYAEKCKTFLEELESEDPVTLLKNIQEGKVKPNELHDTDNETCEESKVNNNKPIVNNESDEDQLIDETTKKVQQMKKIDLYNQTSDSSLSDDDEIVPGQLLKATNNSQEVSNHLNNYPLSEDLPMEVASVHVSQITENNDENKEGDETAISIVAEVNGEINDDQVLESDEDERTSETTIRRVQQMKKMNLYAETSDTCSSDGEEIPQQILPKVKKSKKLSKIVTKQETNDVLLENENCEPDLASCEEVIENAENQDDPISEKQVTERKEIENGIETENKIAEQNTSLPSKGVPARKIIKNSSCISKPDKLQAKIVEEKIRKIPQLIERDNLKEYECASTFELKSMNEDEEIWIFEAPKNLFDENLKGKKMLFKKSTLQLGDTEYKMLKRDSRSSLSCVFNEGQQKSNFKIVNIRPVKAIVLSRQSALEEPEVFTNKQTNQSNNEDDENFEPQENDDVISFAANEVFSSTRVDSITPYKKQNYLKNRTNLVNNGICSEDDEEFKTPTKKFNLLCSSDEDEFEHQMIKKGLGSTKSSKYINNVETENRTSPSKRSKHKKNKCQEELDSKVECSTFDAQKINELTEGISPKKRSRKTLKEKTSQENKSIKRKLTQVLDSEDSSSEHEKLDENKTETKKVKLFSKRMSKIKDEVDYDSSGPVVKERRKAPKMLDSDESSSNSNVLEQSKCEFTKKSNLSNNRLEKDFTLQNPNVASYIRELENRVKCSNNCKDLDCSLLHKSFEKLPKSNSDNETLTKSKNKIKKTKKQKKNKWCLDNFVTNTKVGKSKDVPTNCTKEENLNKQNTKILISDDSDKKHTKSKTVKKFKEIVDQLEKAEICTNKNSPKKRNTKTEKSKIKKENKNPVKSKISNCSANESRKKKLHTDLNTTQDIDDVTSEGSLKSTKNNLKEANTSPNSSKVKKNSSCLEQVKSIIKGHVDGKNKSVSPKNSLKNSRYSPLDIKKSEKKKLKISQYSSESDSQEVTYKKIEFRIRTKSEQDEVNADKSINSSKSDQMNTSLQTRVLFTE